MRDSRICYDIYALARERTRELIDRFIETYVDLSANESQDGEEFMVAPDDGEGPLDNPHGRPSDWPPVLPLSRILDVGLAQPPRAFTAYLESRDPRLCRAYLAFTRDDRLILGLSSPWVEHAIPTEDTTDDQEFKEALSFARSLLTELIKGFGPPPGEQFGVITIEAPPPLDTREIRAFLQHIGGPFSLILPAGADRFSPGSTRS